MISRLAVVRRYQRQVLAAFLSDKWFKEKRAELNALLKKPLESDLDYWWHQLDPVMGFFKQFQKDFAEIVQNQKPRRWMADRIDFVQTYLDKLSGGLPRIDAGMPDWNDPKFVMRWEVTSVIEDKIKSQAKVVGDLFKSQWVINREVINGLAETLLRAASPDEIDTLVNDRRYNAKLDFLERVKLKQKALKLVKRVRLDGFDPTTWVDRTYDMLKAGYSEQAVQEQSKFDEFSLGKMKVVVDDKSLSGQDIESYVKYLIEAKARLESKGFGDAWYGVTFISCKECGGVNPNTSGGTGGWYEFGPDTVTIFSRPGPFIVELMIHELGHRYWFKSMSQTQRGKFETLVKTHTVERPQMPADVVFYSAQDIDKAKNPLRDVEKSIRASVERASKYAPDKITPLARMGISRDGRDFVQSIEYVYDLLSRMGVNDDPKVREVIGKVQATSEKVTEHFAAFSNVTTPEAQETWADQAMSLVRDCLLAAVAVVEETYKAKNRKTLEEHPEAREWLMSLKNNPAPVPAVSNYGRSNVDEAFAEVFMHYVTGTDITQDQAESFRAALRTASTEPLVLPPHDAAWGAWVT